MGYDWVDLVFCAVFLWILVVAGCLALTCLVPDFTFFYFFVDIFFTFLDFRPYRGL